MRLSKYARPAYRPCSLFAALLVKEHLRLNDRGLEATIVLIDEEDLPQKLMAYERFHNWELNWVPTELCDGAGTAVQPEDRPG